MKSNQPQTSIPTPPFCINCQSFIGLDSPESKSPTGDSAPRCRKFPVLDIVFGERFYIACNAVRSDDAPCATAGKLFTPRDDLDKPAENPTSKIIGGSNLTAIEPDQSNLN